MKGKLKRRGAYILVLLFVLAALCGCVLDYAIQNGRAVKATIYQTLGDAAQQQLMLLNAKLKDQLSLLMLMADEAGLQGAEMTERLSATWNRVAETYGFFGIALIDASSGVARLSDGQTFDASGRAYFLRALQGKHTVQYVEQISNTRRPLVVLTVPVLTDGEAKAVLLACYEVSGFQALLKAMAFDGQSYSYITDGNGQIIIGADHGSSLVTGGNLLETAARSKLEDGATAKLIEEHMHSGDTFTFSMALNGQRRYVSFMPTGINDWLLFYVTMEEVVAERASAYSGMVYILASKLLAIFAVLLAILWYYEQRRQRYISLREEEFRVAAGQSDKVILRYDVQRKTVSYATGHAPTNPIKWTLTENVPESVIASGLVAEESVDEYLSMFAAMRRGEPTGIRVCRMKTSEGGFAWLRYDFTLVGEGKKPRYAIVSYYDVTKQREQEIVYKKWQQSIRERNPASYSLFHCTIGKGTSLIVREGSLVSIVLEQGPFDFDACMDQYAAEHVTAEDREKLSAFLTADALLSYYYHEKRLITLEYRASLPADGFRWMRLTVELVARAYSTDIEAYLLFENIDRAKRAELDILERAETDPLTGLLNRATFARRVDEMLGASAPEARHALLMLDIDGFKRVNDTLGHGAGDQTLIDIAQSLSRGSRRSDLVGRLGGDEFVVFLPDIAEPDDAARKARQICAVTGKTLARDVRISGSVGIALYPQDGDSFEALYKKADDALYCVKGAGKNSHAFYREGMATAHGSR